MWKFSLINNNIKLSVSYYHVTYAFQSELRYMIVWMSRNSCSKKVPYLNFMWLQQDSNPQPLSFYMNTQRFSQTGQMIKLCCEYLSLRCIWLYVIITSHTSFRVNQPSIVAWKSRKSLLKTCMISEVQMTATVLEPTTN